MRNVLQRSNVQEFETAYSTIDLTNSRKKRHLKILHVDDDRNFLEVSSQILSTEEGLDVDTAESADTALEKLKKQTYDVVISDYEMPSKNGLDLLKELRLNKIDTPFILFTGKGREEVIVNALNLGADRYINKNGSPEIVYRELENAITQVAESKKAKQLLIESEMKYRTVVEKSSQGIVIILADPIKVVYANTPLCENLGYSSEEMLSLSPEAIMELVFQDDRTLLFERLQNRFEGETVKRGLEFRVVRKNGSIFWVEAFSNPIEYDGQLAVLGMFLDIDESKKANQALRASEERLIDLANLLPEMVFEFDVTGRVTFINQKTIDFSGFSREEILGRNIMQFLVPDDRERAIENSKISLAGKDVGLNEYRLFRKDGTPFTVLVRTSRIVCDNRVVGLRGLMIDIGERKKMEEALQENEAHYRLLAEREHATNEELRSLKFRSLFENMFDGFAYCKMIFDHEGKPIDFVYLHVNNAFSNLTGIKKSDVLGKKVTEAIPGIKQEHPELFEIYGRVTLTGKPEKFELFFKPLNMWLNLSVYSPKKGYFVAIFENVTERKNVEEVLKNTVARFADLSNSLPEIIFEIDLNGKATFINQLAFETTGYTLGEISNGYQDFQKFIAPEYLEKAGNDFKHAIESSSTIINEYVFKKKDGTRFNAIVKTVPIKFGDKTVGLRGIVTDITEQKRMTETFVFQSQLLEAVGQALIATDKDNVIRYWNKGAENLYGWTAEEVLGKNVDEFLTTEVIKKQITIALDRFLSGESWSAEIQIKNRHEETVPVIVTLNPVFDKSGEYFGSISTYTDITDQKSVELELQGYVAEYATATEKIKELNEKLRVIASLTRHDVRNKLGVLNGYMYLLKKQISGNEVAINHLAKMDEASKQLLAILEFERIYEQINSENLAYVTVEKYFAEASSLVSDFKGIKTQCNCEGLEVLADSLLRQLLYNLMDNTLKYGEKTTLITLHFQRSEKSLLLIYEDNGVGMTDEVRSHLFEKGFGKGTGFGLYMIKRIIEAYGWSIEENGKLGSGAKFTIEIPQDKFRLEK